MCCQQNLNCAALKTKCIKIVGLYWSKQSRRRRRACKSLWCADNVATSVCRVLYKSKVTQRRARRARQVCKQEVLKIMKQFSWGIHEAPPYEEVVVLVILLLRLLVLPTFSIFGRRPLLCQSRRRRRRRGRGRTAWARSTAAAAAFASHFDEILMSSQTTHTTKIPSATTAKQPEDGHPPMRREEVAAYFSPFSD